MDTTTYDETRLKKDEDWARYLKEGSDVNLLLWKGRVISVDPPTTVELEVVETEPNVKGNTVSGTLLSALRAQKLSSAQSSTFRMSQYLYLSV